MVAHADSGPGGPVIQLRRATTLADVIETWRREGPLVHHETIFPSLNRLTGGGPVFGTRWYVMGAPDACKTLFLSVLAQVWDAQGLIVGMLAVDEEPGDLAQRFIQRLRMPERFASGPGEPPPHFCRAQCEDRDDRILDAMLESSSKMGVVFYGSDWTIESAAFNLSEIAKAAGKRAALTVDSIQTVECNAMRASGGEVSLRERITENTKAIRFASSRYGMIAVATSEMNRAAYRSIAKVEQNDMAAAKESGAIEYSARVMLAMRTMPEEEDCIEVKVIKNKHGPSFPSADPFYLRLDRPRQMLSEREPPASTMEVPLESAVLSALAATPEGLSTSGVRVEVGKNLATVMACLQSLRSAGKVQRIGGERAPWTLTAESDSNLDFP